MMFKKYIISKFEATNAGLTHKATLYGVDVYVKNPYKANIDIAFKFTPAIYWVDICEGIINCFVMFAPSDYAFELPLKNLVLLKGEK